jgi:hypothetical protein
MLLMKDNSARLKNEFDQLRTENNELWEMVLNNIVPYCKTHFNKDVTVTMILRTQAEQDSIYKGSVNSKGRKYDEKPWKSPHQFWHAVDLRSRDFSKDQITQLNDYINGLYNPINYYSFTIFDHNVGLGEHWHLQFVRK